MSIDTTLPLKRADEIRPGDTLDLEGDAFADPNRDNPIAEYDFFVVCGIERETLGCVRLDFENAPSVGFPPAHLLRVWHHDVTYDE